MPPKTPRSRSRRRAHALLAALAILLCCSRDETPVDPGSLDRAEGAPETLRLRYQGSVGTVIYPELAADLGFLAPLELDWIGNTISGPQSIQSVVTGDTDFGGAFNGAIVKLFAARAPIRAVIGYYGVDALTWSGFYVLEDSPIRSARDLLGASVAMNTLGAHAEFILREYLARSGLDEEEARQVSMIVVPPIHAEQSLRAGQVQVATLTGLFRDKALERGGLRKLFSDQELYGEFTAGSLVFSEDFIRENPNTVRAFVEGTARAIEWARSAPREEVRARYRAIIAARQRNEDDSLVGYWLSTGIAHPGGRIEDREFQLWIDWLVKDGALQPGQVKPADLYTNSFQPYAAEPDRQAEGTPARAREDG